MLVIQKKRSSERKRERERKFYHATFVINKTSKLNFIKVMETFQIDIEKNSLPDEKSRARRKYRPELFREPGNL